MKINRQTIRRILLEIMSSKEQPKMHMCMDGSQVKFGSDECVLDIEDRIADATHSRNDCDIRTDARHHYNGILNVLRRDLRSAKKKNDSNAIVLEV